jgi:hypothetical protein
MKRTTIYLEPELEMLLKLEVLRQKKPMAELVREAVRTYVARTPGNLPPGAGKFASGRADTADRAEELLAQTGFGTDRTSRAARIPRPKRRRA